MLLLQARVYQGAMALLAFPKARGHSLGKSYPYAKMQSVYSTVPAAWAIDGVSFVYIIIIIMSCRQHGYP